MVFGKGSVFVKRFAALCLFIGMVCWPSVVLSQWVSIGDGIDYQEFTAAGPNRLFVSRLTRSNPNAIIDTSIAKGSNAGSLEIVRNQAARENDALNWWGGTWGARNDVVAAVNGGFYSKIENTTTYTIDGGQIQSGWFVHSFIDPAYPNATNNAFSGFSWKTDRSVFQGECVQMTGAKVYVKFMPGGSNLPINGINIHPDQVTNNRLYIYTPQYSSKTPALSRTEVLVEMTRPNLTTSGAGYSSGIIRSVKLNSGSSWIPFDHVILSADGNAGGSLQDKSVVGAEVRIFQEIIDLNEPDVQGQNACQTETGQNWANVFASINTNYHFLKNNVVRVPDAVARPGYIGYVNLNPRTAICWNSTYVFFVVCDGRTTQSVGMSCETLGNWAKSALGATDGVNLDGGGSSTMVVNGTVKNVVSDGQERAVCNGIMMINVKPAQKSTQFTAGQSIFTTGSANSRLGPGTNYAVITTVAAGTQGTIVPHNINGIYAKGYYWWKCNFGGTVGWVAQSSLTTTPGQAPPNIAQQPTDQTVGAGDSALFTIVATGDGTLNYQWQKNQVNISNGGRYSGATTASLTISNCDNNDAGKYRCVVTSIYGSASSIEANLTVGPPTTEFIVESRSGGKNFAKYSEIGTWGNNDTYKSSAPGCTAGIGHRWCTLGSTPVSATFAFTPAIGGTYEVFTTNCTTSNSGNPLIHKVAHAGGTASVGVCQNTDCTPNAVNKWYSLGEYELNAGTQYDVTLDGSTGAGSAPASNAGRSDAIKWSLINANGPIITQHPSNQTTALGGGATFTVAATGSGTLTYIWQKNQVNLTNGGHYSGVTTATLTVSNADTNDAANYRCVVTDNTGSATSNEAALTISICSPPVLTNGDFEAGGAANPPTGWTTYIQTNASGNWTIQTSNPAQGAQYQQTQVYNADNWGGVRQNVTGLSSGSVYTISGAFRTNSVSATASVRYSLTGNANRTNSSTLASTPSTTWVTFSGTVTAAGTSMMLFLDHLNGGATNKASAFDAIVIEATGCQAPTPPSITQQPAGQAVCPGSNASFSVTAAGDAPLSYQWQKNSANLANGGHYSGATTATLTITGADSNDAANYRCVVSNAGGSTTSNPAALTLLPRLAADLDGDCDVDQDDLDLFIACSSGPQISPVPGCESSDLDHDGDVDQSDFGIFQRCFGGEDIPLDPDCAG